ncbi:MAG: hypothetical protein COB02_07955 [Candidatus Cloacimonadota bacterium]|nr:MAG: hypothetical protein COB02_07955 [Candidatus Cloacimonadota bacterium]
MSEWASKPSIKHLALYPKGSYGISEKLIEIPLLNRFEVSTERVENDINPAMYQFGAIGGLLGFAIRGNRKQSVYGSVYMKLIDLPAGNYEFIVSTTHRKERHRKKMNIKSLNVKSGEITLFTHHWGNDRLFDTNIANTIGYEEALDKYLAKYKKHLPIWPYEKLTSNKILKLKLDMDYKERQHARRPKVVLYNAKLQDGSKEINAHILYDGIKSFGKGDDRYTHTYYTLELDAHQLKKDMCYSLRLEGVSILNGMEVKKFDGNKIQSEKIICPNGESLIEIKANRVTASTWEVKLKN